MSLICVSAKGGAGGGGEEGWGGGDGGVEKVGVKTHDALSKDSEQD